MHSEIKIEGSGRDANAKKEVDLQSLTDYYKGFETQFKLFEKEILEGNFEKVDAWCDALVKGDIPEFN